MYNNSSSNNNKIATTTTMINSNNNMHIENYTTVLQHQQLFEEQKLQVQQLQIQHQLDEEDFDMFDITTGKIVQYDQNQPVHYGEASIRWDDNDIGSDSPNGKISPPPQQHHHQQPQLLQPIVVNATLQQIQQSPSPPQVPAAVPVQPPPQPVYVECKDMDPLTKVNQLQPYVSELFDVACHRFYRTIIDSGFWSDVSKEMGFYDMVEGEWSVSPTGCHQQRELNFKTPISFKIGPKVATVKQIQKIRRTPGGGYFMETSSLSTDVPYGENFSVENYISLEPMNKSSCHLKVSTAVKFTKSIWGLTNLIEKSVIQSNKDFFAVWTRMAKLLIQENRIQHSVIESPVQNQRSSPPPSIPPPIPQQPQPSHSEFVNNNHNNTNNHNHIDNNGNINNNSNTTLSFNNYEDLKNLFYQLFRENLNPRAIKVISHKSGKHITNITIHHHYTVSHVFQNIIPQAITELINNQNYEVFWQDKRGDASVFFLKDMDLPLFNYLQSSDSIFISTLTNNEATKKPYFFQVLQQGKKAILIPNQK